MIKKLFKRAALIVGALLVFALPAQATDYTFDYFLAPSQITRSNVMGLNNNGISVGRPDSNKNYYVYDGTNFIFPTIVNYPADYSSRTVLIVHGINDNSVIVGTIDWYSQRHKGFTIIGDTIEYFRMKPEWVTYATGIANDGTIVGYGAATNTSIREGYILRDGVFEYVTHPLDVGGTFLWDINSDGSLIVGHYLTADDVWVPFLYDGTNFHDISLVPDSIITRCWDVNIHGVVACNYKRTDLTWDIALYNRGTGTFELLGTPAFSDFWAARSINDNGAIGGDTHPDGPGGVVYGVLITPVSPPLPEELAIHVEKYRLTYDKELLTGITRLAAQLELLPDGITILQDGTVLQAVVVTVVLPGLGENGADLVLTDEFDVVVTNKPGVVKLKQVE